jgi:predicted metalloprotease with PDZ domain
VTQVWGDMVRFMPQGLPNEGDQGLDGTREWGRTYWGGALFCLLADVRTRHESHNRKGLVDALRAVNRAGGNIESDWPLERAFKVGDKATGTTVLMSLYGQMGAKSMPVDLPDLWKQLGVQLEAGQVTFDNDAPLAKVRAAISS